jgi:hypothetical protein
MGAQAGGCPTAGRQRSIRHRRGQGGNISRARGAGSDVEYPQSVASGDRRRVVGERPSAEEFGDDVAQGAPKRTPGVDPPHKQLATRSSERARRPAPGRSGHLSGRPLVIEDPTVLERCNAIARPGCRVAGGSASPRALRRRQLHRQAATPGQDLRASPREREPSSRRARLDRPADVLSRTATGSLPVIGGGACPRCARVAPSCAGSGPARVAVELAPRAGAGAHPDVATAGLPLSGSAAGSFGPGARDDERDALRRAPTVTATMRPRARSVDAARLDPRPLRLRRAPRGGLPSAPSGPTACAAGRSPRHQRQCSRCNASTVTRTESSVACPRSRADARRCRGTARCRGSGKKRASPASGDAQDELPGPALVVRRAPDRPRRRARLPGLHAGQ